MNQNNILSEISNKIVDWIMAQKCRTEISLNEIFTLIYEKEGYRWIRHEEKGWVSSNDNGATYLITDWDLFGILEEVESILTVNKRQLDFSQWDNMCAGLPYNLPFVIRNKD